jgi:hypothetical protein
MKQGLADGNTRVPSSTIVGWQATTKRAVDKSKQQPTIAH